MNIFKTNSGSIEQDLKAFDVPDSKIYILRRYIRMKMLVAMLLGMCIGVVGFICVISSVFR